MSDERGKGTPESSTDFWERIYRARDRPSTGLPSPVLAEVASTLTPGTALDLGCALGDDCVWLASKGWRVTGVDVSAEALRRAAEQATERGLGDRVCFERHDLASSFPQGSFDLISAVHLESPIEFGRDAALRRAAQAVARRGLLLVVTHGSVRPWAWNQDPGTRFATPEESLAALELDPDRWEVVISGAPEREATGPGGEIAKVVDVVSAVRRRGESRSG